eukprot:9048822-Alexandrium_andersonii.AAC.1
MRALTRVSVDRSSVGAVADFVAARCRVGRALRLHSRRTHLAHSRPVGVLRLGWGVWRIRHSRRGRRSMW